MKFLCSLITVNDIKRSRHFYESVLGQKVKTDYGENVTFYGDFAIHLKSHFQQLIAGNEIKSRSNNFELYFEHDNIDEIAAKLNEFGVTYVHEIREQPWRQKVMRFYDPDENMVELGESMEYLSFRLHCEGLPAEKIAAITYMPLALVTASIEKFSNERGGA